ncbi:MAG: autotransporter domain-containing protein [Pseudomonadota bacterium]
MRREFRSALSMRVCLGSVVALMSGTGGAYAVDISASTTGAAVPAAGDTIQSGVTVDNSTATGTTALVITSGTLGTPRVFTNNGNVRSVAGSSVSGIGANGNDFITINNNENGLIESLGTGNAIRLDKNITISNEGTVHSQGGAEAIRLGDNANVTNIGMIRQDRSPASAANSIALRLDTTGIVINEEDGLILNAGSATTYGAGNQGSNVYALSVAGDGGIVHVTNYGIIRASGDSGSAETGHDEGEVGAVRLRGNANMLENYGLIETTGHILASPDSNADSSDDTQEIGDMYGVRIDGASDELYNYEGATIIGGKHAVTLDEFSLDAYIYNEGTITGLNGSGVGSDATAGTVTVENSGMITGQWNSTAFAEGYAAYFFGDGDGVDIDHTASITNTGTIQGLGSQGIKPGETNPSTSEGIAMGGGTIDNGDATHTDALISGADNGILVDDSNSGDAFTSTTITNYGTIRGLDGYGIRLVNDAGSFNNRIDNFGTISGSNGIAVETGDGDDTFNNFGGTITGTVNAEAGDDTLNIDRGAGTEYALNGSQFSGFETTNIYSGTVTLTNAYTSATLLDVFADTTFVGNGDVTTITFRNSGYLATGTQITTNTFNIDGDFISEAGSNLLVKLDGTKSDLIAVSGGATLNGGTVSVFHLKGIESATYTILTTDNGVNGTFDGLDLSAFVEATLNYGTDDVTLTIDPLADTLNGSAIAAALSNARNDLGLSSLPSGDIGAALNDLAPVTGTAATGAGVTSSQSFTTQTNNRIALLQSSQVAEAGGTRLAITGMSAGDDMESATTAGVWLRGFGLTGSLDASNAGQDGLDYNGGGFVVGYDMPVGKTALVGVSGGYARISSDMDRPGATSDVDSYLAGVYAASMLGDYDLSAQLGYVRNDYEQSRLITFAGLTASADYSGDTFSGNAEFGRTFTFGSTALRPAVGIDAMHLKIDSYTETGAPGFNLTAADHSDNLVRSTIGVSARFGTGNVVPSLGLRWGHDLEQADGALSYAFSGLANSTFGINANMPDRDAALIDAGIDATLSDTLDLSAGASADLRDNTENYGLSVKLHLHW